MSPDCVVQFHSFKLEFDCTSNIAEYEALVIGLNLLREKKAQQIHIFGDSELVVNQVNSVFQTKHPGMRAYRNEVWDMFTNFFFLNVKFH